MLHAHGGVEGLLGDVLRIHVAALEVGRQHPEAGDVVGGRLDEALVRGGAGVPVDTLGAAAACRGRNEDKRRRNDAESPQDGDYIGGTGLGPASLELVPLSAEQPARCLDVIRVVVGVEAPSDRLPERPQPCPLPVEPW